MRVSYNGSVSLHRRTVIWEDNVVTDPVQWVDAFRESYLNSSPTATVPSLFNNYMPYSNAWFEELKRRRADPTMDNYDIDANGNYNYYGETNWLKEIYKSVNYSTTHAVSIQGGREGSVTTFRAVTTTRTASTRWARRPTRSITSAPRVRSASARG